MKTRAKILLTMSATALTLLFPLPLSAQKAKAPAHARQSSEQAKGDTTVYSATKSLIESVGELSRTASKLSETALKLLETQEMTNGHKTQPAPAMQQTKPYQPEEEETIIEDITISRQTPESREIIRDTVYVTVRDTIEYTIFTSPEENRNGGKYIWVPDAELQAVESVLDGKFSLSPSSEINLSEMTFWRGDSIPLALPTKRLGRYDRKLYNWLIYPKGLWHISLSANYGELNTEDMEIMTLIDDVDLHGKIYSIKPSVSYFLRNNLCVGMRLNFTKGDMGINSFKVDIDEDINFNLHDIKYNYDSYSAAIFLQQYFGLSRRGRFAVFNEAEISVGTGNSHFVRPFDGELRDTRTKNQSFNINYSPGVSIMMMKNAAFNLSFGIFGFHLKSEKQWENAEESGSRFTSGINFRFNIFNINFGVSIII